MLVARSRSRGTYPPPPHHRHPGHNSRMFIPERPSSTSKIFSHAGSNPITLKNSTEYAEPLLIALSEATCTQGSESDYAT